MISLLNRLVRHVDDLRAGPELEQLHAEVQYAAAAGGAIR
jgi:hypothetical protein